MVHPVMTSIMGRVCVSSRCQYGDLAACNSQIENCVYNIHSMQVHVHVQSLSTSIVKRYRMYMCEHGWIKRC